jgi:hypothetical protein
MSQRHRSHDVAPPPRMDLRAHAHNERHRIHSELHAVAATVSAGVEPDELHEPGRAWVPQHHHDAERGRAKRTPNLKHWKVKAWKRRTAMRKQRAQAFRLAAEQA